METSKYTPEFRTDAVAPYHASPGHTYTAIANDLDTNHQTLRIWVREAEQTALPETAEATAPAEFYESLYTRSDVLFELTDALQCTDEPVRTLVDLSPAAEHRRGHAALDRGWLEPTRLRHKLATLPTPRLADRHIALAVDVSNWLRPDAPTSIDRLFCHVYRRGRNADQMIPS